MKLIKQQILYFKEANSDKVYEVDLCEVDKNKYVVNFRYGRRGTTLKDGTKTVLPVSLAEAEKLYTEIINSKTQKGYKNSLAAFAEKSAQTGSTGKVPGAFNPERQRQYIIEEIIKAAAKVATGTYKPGKPGHWSFPRMIRKAGELKLGAVEAVLLQCLGRSSELLDYTIVRSLGQVCQDKSLVINTLVKLYNQQATPQLVKRITVEALLKIMTPAQQEEFKAHLVATLPSALRTLETDTPESFYEALKKQLDPDNPQSFTVLYTLYQIDNRTTRPALLRILQEAPLKPSWFRQVRYIFKAAEYRQDAEFFGLLAYRFATTRAMWDNERHYSTRYNGKYYNRKQIKESLEKGEALFAYSSKTRLYFRRRTARTLRQTGARKDAQYVKLACAVLSFYKDEDGGKPFCSRVDHWRYDRATRRSYRETRSTHYDSFAHFLAFNYILYHNSPRYVLKNRSYRCRPGYEPGKPVPAAREEAFPELWDAQFREIPPLLAKSCCERVHQFGVKILEQNQEFLTHPLKEEAIILLRSPYLVSAELGLKIVDKVLQQSLVDGAILSSLLCSLSPGARQKGMSLLDHHSALVTNELLLELLFSPFRDTRQYLTSFLTRFPLLEKERMALIGKIVSNLVLAGKPAGKQEQAFKEQLEDITALLLTVYKAQCSQLAEGVLLDLISHPVEQMQQLGAQILLIHHQYAKSPPDRIIQMLLKSPYPSVMGLGVKLFGQLPEKELFTKELALKEFLLHPLPEVQKQARPIIRKLALLNADFAGNFLSILLSHLFRLKDEEKINYLVCVIREDFSGVNQLPAVIIWRMLHSRETALHELGGHFLAQSPVMNTLTTSQVLELANKDALNVRRLAWQWCSTHLDQLKADMEITVKLLDAKWEDSREFAFKFIESGFCRDDFTTLALVAICDSTREEVQQFGKKLLMTHFREEQGADYLVKLSEHPARSIQFFITNLLDKYASGSPERISRLTDYMERVLLSVNKARTVKERILLFMEQEAAKNRESAACFVPLLNKLTGTIAVTYRDQALALLLKILSLYPDLALSGQNPVRIVETEVRNVV